MDDDGQNQLRIPPIEEWTIEQLSAVAAYIDAQIYELTVPMAQHAPPREQLDPSVRQDPDMFRGQGSEQGGAQQRQTVVVQNMQYGGGFMNAGHMNHTRKRRRDDHEEEEEEMEEEEEDDEEEQGSEENEEVNVNAGHSLNGRREQDEDEEEEDEEADEPEEDGEDEEEQEDGSEEEAEGSEGASEQGESDQEEDMEEEMEEDEQPPRMETLTLTNFLNLSRAAQDRQRPPQSPPGFFIENLLAMPNTPYLLQLPPQTNPYDLLVHYEGILRVQVTMVKDSMQKETLKDPDNINNFGIAMQLALHVVDQCDVDGRARIQNLREYIPRAIHEGRAPNQIVQYVFQDLTVMMTEFLAKTNKAWQELQDEANREVGDDNEEDEEEDGGEDRVFPCDTFPALYEASKHRTELYNQRFDALVKKWQETEEEEQKDWVFAWIDELDADVDVIDKFSTLVVEAQKKIVGMDDLRGAIPQDEFDHVKNWTLHCFESLNRYLQDESAKIEESFEATIARLDQRAREAMVEERQELLTMAGHWENAFTYMMHRFREQVNRLRQNFLTAEERIQMLVDAQREELARYNVGGGDDEEEGPGGIDGMEEEDRLVIEEIMEEEDEEAGRVQPEGEAEQEEEDDEDEDDETMMRRMQGREIRMPESHVLHLPPDGNLIWPSWDENKVWEWVDTFLPESNQCLREMELDGYNLFCFLNETGHWHTNTMPLAWFMKLKANMNRLINHYNSLN